MKIRTDYVTNSSSSSFVIAIKDTSIFDGDHPAPIKAMAKLGLRFLLEGSNAYEHATTLITDEESLDQLFLALHGWTPQGWTYPGLEVNTAWQALRSDHWRYKALLEEGYKIVYHCISHHDYTATQFLSTACDGEHIIMLEGDV